MSQVGQKVLLYMTGILVSTLFVDGWTHLGLKEIVTVMISHKKSNLVSNHFENNYFQLSNTFLFLSLITAVI